MCGQQPGRDVRVVLDEVALGDPEVGPEGLAEVREAHRARPEAHLDVVDVAREGEGGGDSAAVAAPRPCAARGAGAGRAPLRRRGGARLAGAGSALRASSAPPASPRRRARAAAAGAAAPRAGRRSRRARSPARARRPCSAAAARRGSCRRGPRRRTGTASRSPNTSSSTSTYLPLAMLPSRTTSQVGPGRVVDEPRVAHERAPVARPRRRRWGPSRSAAGDRGPPATRARRAPRWA